MNLPPACANTYRVERPISSGGFGTVLLARHVRLDREVALKLLHGEVLGDAEQRERFIAEARVTAALDHPNIVRVLDHGVDDGVPWIAYEYLPGRTLAEMLKGGALDWRYAVSAAAQVAAALEAAHAAGVLHRDVKPANVLEAEPGRIKITDFGIAKFTGAHVKTKTGIVLGTPAYMSPELIRGETPTAAADLHALGALLFELLTGLPPFTGDHPVAVLTARLSGEAPDLTRTLPEAPRAVPAIVAALLAADPAARPCSASEAKAALEAIIADLDAAQLAPRPRTFGSGRITRKGVAAVAGKPAATAGVTRPNAPAATLAGGIDPADAPRSRAALALGLGSALALAALGVFAASRKPAAPPSPSPAPSAVPSASASPSAGETAVLMKRFELLLKEWDNAPSFLDILHTLTDMTTKDHGDIDRQIRAYADWSRPRQAKMVALLADARALRDSGADSPGLRVLIARAMIYELVTRFDLDHHASVYALAEQLKRGERQFSPMGGEVDIAREMPYRKKELQTFVKALVQIRMSLEDIAREPAAAIPAHGLLFNDVRWIGSLFVYYNWEGEEPEFATQIARRWLLDPLKTASPLVAGGTVDAWELGFGRKKFVGPALDTALGRLNELAKLAPGMGETLLAHHAVYFKRATASVTKNWAASASTIAPPDGTGKTSDKSSPATPPVTASTTLQTK